MAGMLGPRASELWPVPYQTSDAATNLIHAASVNPGTAEFHGEYSHSACRVGLIRRTAKVFEAVQEAYGGYCAECLTENIFTQGDTWDELRRKVVEATAAFFFDQRIRLHFLRKVATPQPTGIGTSA